MRRMPSVLLLLFISIAAVAQDAQALYEEGVKLKNGRKTREALDKFKQAVQLRPGYTDALYEMGWCLNDVQDYSGAVKALRQVVPVWTTTPKCFFELGYAFDKLNMMDSAMYYYNRCLELKPDYSGVYKQLGYITYNKGDNAATLDYFAKYESYAKTPSTDYLYWYRKGFTLNAEKDYTGAKTALLKSLSNKSNYTNTLFELGYACTRLKEDEEAIGYFQKAIELEPRNHIGYNGIAEVYRDNKKDIAEAMNWYQKTLSINANERKANFGMGYCLNSSGKYNEAIGYLRKAISEEDTYTAAYVEIGYSYFKTGNNTEALANLDKALGLNSKNENARYYKGLIYISQKDKISAQRMVDELQRLNSRHAATLREAVGKM